MKANELRIGNLINPDCGDLEHIAKVISISENDCCIEFIDENYEKFLSNYQEINLENIKPIPLTEDWLLKFGFKHIRDNWYNTHSNGNTFNVYLFQSKIGFRVEIVSQSIAVLKYVNQLQNLYFTLTSEELIINENL